MILKPVVEHTTTTTEKTKLTKTPSAACVSKESTKLRNESKESSLRNRVGFCDLRIANIPFFSQLLKAKKTKFFCQIQISTRL